MADELDSVAGEAVGEPSPVLDGLVVDERPRWKMTLAYEGTGFHGWQKQVPRIGEPLRTVAGVTEQTMVNVLRQPITLVGASRTDAGVHALGQVAHFNAETGIPQARLAMALNARLPEDVLVRSVEPAGAEFDAISDAKRKQYRYRIYNDEVRPLWDRQYVWHCRHELDPDRMQTAAAKLVGEHDFEGFAQASHGRTTTVRTILDCHIEVKRPEVQIVVVGTGFLYNMVRIIAGTLQEVGRGRLEPEVVEEVLATRERRLAGPTLGPSGLCLEWIAYD